MLIDSAAHLWQRLERYAPLAARPQRSTFDAWIANLNAGQELDAAASLQIQRDYRRLCSLIDQLETLLHDSPAVLRAIQSRIAQQAPDEAA
jgi:hypothetical protein